MANIETAAFSNVARRLFGREGLLANGSPKPEIAEFLRGLVLLAFGEPPAPGEVSLHVRYRREFGLPDEDSDDGTCASNGFLSRQILMRFR